MRIKNARIIIIILSIRAFCNKVKYCRRLISDLKHYILIYIKIDNNMTDPIILYISILKCVEKPRVRQP